MPDEQLPDLPSGRKTWAPLCSYNFDHGCDEDCHEPGTHFIHGVWFCGKHKGGYPPGPPAREVPEW